METHNDAIARLQLTNAKTPQSNSVVPPQILSDPGTTSDPPNTITFLNTYLHCPQAYDPGSFFAP
jgi:hypothetical protein